MACGTTLQVYTTDQVLLSMLTEKIKGQHRQYPLLFAQQSIHFALEQQTVQMHISMVPLMNCVFIITVLFPLQIFKPCTTGLQPLLPTGISKMGLVHRSVIHLVIAIQAPGMAQQQMCGQAENMAREVILMEQIILSELLI